MKVSILFVPASSFGLAIEHVIDSFTGVFLLDGLLKGGCGRIVHLGSF